MKKLAIAALAAALTAPVAAFAAPSYTYVQGGYLNVDPSNASNDLEGYFVGASFQIAPNVFIVGGYNNTEGDGAGPFGGQFSAEVQTYNVGAGIRAPITDYMDFNLAAAYVHAEGDYDSPFGAATSKDDGFSVTPGLRTLLGEHLEVVANYNYIDVAEDAESSFDVGGLVHITKMFSVGGTYRFGDNADGWNAGLRVNF